MRILIVEDRGSALYPLQDALEGLGHQVLTALGVAQARAEWNSGQCNIACIIVDLNVPADVRSKVEIEQRNQTSKNKEWYALAGWIWLEQEGLVKRMIPPAKCTPKIVTYSAYLDVWQAQGYRESDYPGVRFFRKDPGAAQNLLDHVKTIAAGQERSR